MTIKRELQKVRRRIEGLLYEPMRPGAMVIGTQKGGTTALSHYLALHPGVVASRQKEIHFFNQDERFLRGPAFYHSYFESRTPARRQLLSLDITPAYLAAASVTAGRIHDYDPAMRLVAVLRDPVTRAFSAWQMYRQYFRRNPQWFAGWADSSVLDGYPRGCRARRSGFGASFLADVQEEIEVLEQGELIEMSVIYQGFYARHLTQFFQYFPASQMLVLGSEAMKAETRHHLQQLEEYLGLAPYDWRDEQIKPHFEGGYSEPMPDEAGRLLADYYKPHNQALFALLDREFHWS